MAIAFLIKVQDVRIVGEEDFKKMQINFDYQQKRKNNGFTYYDPSIYLPLFYKYMSELQIKNLKTTCFLQNWNVKAQKRIQKSGKNLVKHLHKKTYKILKISSEDYTTHCWRRSAASNLADRDVFLINHGPWKQDDVVEGYITNSKSIRRERETCLLPASLVVPEPNPQPVPNDLQTLSDLQGFSQLYNNEFQIDHEIDPHLPLS